MRLPQVPCTSPPTRNQCQTKEKGITGARSSVFPSHLCKSRWKLGTWAVYLSFQSAQAKLLAHRPGILSFLEHIQLPHALKRECLSGCSRGEARRLEARCRHICALPWYWHRVAQQKQGRCFHSQQLSGITCCSDTCISSSNSDFSTCDLLLKGANTLARLGLGLGETPVSTNKDRPWQSQYP